MYFRQFLNDETACASYLFGCKSSRRVRGRRPARRPGRRLHRRRRGAGVADRRGDRDPRPGRPRLGPARSWSSAPARRPTCPRAPGSSSSTSRSPTASVVKLGNTVIEAIATPGHAARPPRLPGHRPPTRSRSRGWSSPATRCWSATPAGRTCTPTATRRVEEMARTLYRSLTERLLRCPTTCCCTRPTTRARSADAGSRAIRPRRSASSAATTMRSPSSPRTRSSPRWSRTSRRRPSTRPRSSPPTAAAGRWPAARLSRAPGSSSGCARTSPQFSLLVAVNALVGAMVGLERSTLPLIGEDEFGLGSSAAVLSFIVAFGLAKSFTNLGAGALAARVGRRRLLILGWAVALPVPLADRPCTELGLDRGRQRLPRRQPGPGLVDDRGHEDRPGRARSGVASPWASTKRPATAGWPSPRP